MTTQHRELIDHVLSGSASAEQRDEFSALVLSDDTFARAAARHAAMIAEIHERFTGTVAGAIEPTAEKKATGDGGQATTVAPKPIPIYRKGYEPKTKSAIGNRQLAIFSALAATLLAACGVAIYVFVFSVPGPPSPVPSDSAPLANLIENASGGTLTTPGGFISEGRDYPRGEYALSSGTAEFMLTNAVNVKLRGDTRMFMRNDMNVALSNGSADFVVPARATGFTVHTPGGLRVVDKGTAFTVRVDNDRQVRIEVTEGEVEIYEADSASATPLTAGRSIAWNVATGLAQSQTIPLFGLKPKMNGDIRWVHPLPDSLVANAIEDNDEILVLAERTAITSDSPIPTDMGVVPANTPIDVYLLHKDPVGPSDESTPLRRSEATITFDRPILGAFLTAASLAQSDSQLGAPGTRFGDSDLRGLEDHGNGLDTVTLSPDRRTLTLNLVGFAIDQLRVVVESDTTQSQPQPLTQHPLNDEPLAP